MIETTEQVTVTGSHEPAITTVDPTSGNQIFEAETYHAPPTARITQLVQENLLGAARAPTGEVHIRGQHGEYTYYLDGAPIPLGVFGGLNEVVDPHVIDRATFIDGGWPAEYGGQIAAVIDMQTHVPSGGFHLDASTYAGTYAPSQNKDSVINPNRLLNMNGQTLSMSDNIGKFGWFLSGSRQETDRRIDAPISLITDDHGFDYFLYGKADYLLSDKDYLTLNLNYGITNTQVPYDSVELAGTGANANGNLGQYQDDNQYTTNAFQTLSYFRAISSEADHESNLTVAGFAREGSLLYTPGGIDMPTIDSNLGNTSVISEDRSYTTLGVRTKYDNRLSHEFMYAAGFNFDNTVGHEDFGPIDSIAGQQYSQVNIPNAPHTFTTYTGTNFGAFLESEIHPWEWTRFDVGLRYDQQVSPDVGFQSQWSPRIRWNFLIDESNYASLYYGKLFMPTNLDGLSTIGNLIYPHNTYGDTLGGTKAERDEFYEADYVHTFDFGLRMKTDYFYKYASPGVDDATIGSSAIKTPVNIAAVYTQGVELGLSYSSPNTPFSGYLNSSIIHAYGVGTLSGGFVPFLSDGPATDLDHDQRLSVVASLNYQPSDWYANVVGIYGSGLTNGNPQGLSYGTGLFDFNQAEHTTPSWIFNIGGGYTFHLQNGSTISPSLYVGNLFDNEHLLKGAYFSAAYWEEPRSIILKVDYHL
jgi:outer membrane receptor protein involved in Fe transport